MCSTADLVLLSPLKGWRVVHITRFLYKWTPPLSVWVPARVCMDVVGTEGAEGLLLGGMEGERNRERMGRGHSSLKKLWQKNLTFRLIDLGLSFRMGSSERESEALQSSASHPHLKILLVLLSQKVVCTPKMTCALIRLLCSCSCK